MIHFRSDCFVHVKTSLCSSAERRNFLLYIFLYNHFWWTIVSKVRRPDGLLRPKQQPDSPMVFERSVQTRDMVWLGIWTLCFLEAAFLAKRFYARYTSDKKYIRARFSTYVFSKDFWRTSSDLKNILNSSKEKIY